jgi:hypothetical protein
MKYSRISFQNVKTIDRKDIKNTPNEKLTCRAIIILLPLYPTTSSFIKE